MSIPPREVLRLALESVQAINQTLAGLDDIFLEALIKNGPSVQINRGLHRSSHLDEIELAIKRR